MPSPAKKPQPSTVGEVLRAAWPAAEKVVLLYFWDEATPPDARLSSRALAQEIALLPGDVDEACRFLAKRGLLTCEGAHFSRPTPLPDAKKPRRAAANGAPA